MLLKSDPGTQLQRSMVTNLWGANTGRQGRAVAGAGGVCGAGQLPKQEILAQGLAGAA